jgi:hypothetical protein
MQEPGIDEYDWSSEWSDIEDALQDSPVEAIPLADDLVTRMMEARGYPLNEDADAELTEPEITRSYIAAHQIREMIDSPDPIDLGDVASAVELYRDLYERLFDYGPTAGEPA